MKPFRKLRNEFAIARSVGQNDMDEAIRLTHHGLRNTKEDASLLELIAMYHHQADRNEPAVDFAIQALDHDPKLFLANSLLAQIYANQEDDDKAVSYTRQALENYPAPPPQFLHNILGKLQILGHVFPTFKRVSDEELEGLKDPHKEWRNWAIHYLEWYENHNTRN